MTKGMSAVQKEFLYRKLTETQTAIDLELMHASFRHDPELAEIKLRHKETNQVINMVIGIIMESEDDPKFMGSKVAEIAVIKRHNREIQVAMGLAVNSLYGITMDPKEE